MKLLPHPLRSACIAAIAAAAFSSNLSAQQDYYFSSLSITPGNPNGGNWGGLSWNTTSTADPGSIGWANGNIAIFPDSPNANATGIILGANRIVAGLTFQSSPGTGIVYLDGNVGGPFGITLDNNGNTPVIFVEGGQAALAFNSFSGTSGFLKDGAGAFEIRGSATGLSGDVEVADGVLFGGSTADAFNFNGTIFITGGVLDSAPKGEVATMNIGGSIHMTSGEISIGLHGDTSTWSMAADSDLILSGGTFSLTILGLSDFDRITGSGSGVFSLDGVDIDLQSASSVDYTSTYHLFSGFATGDVANLNFLNFDSGYIPSIDSDGVLSFTVVPEPGTFGLLGMGLLFGTAGLLARNRRKNSAR